MRISCKMWVRVLKLAELGFDSRCGHAWEAGAELGFDSRLRAWSGRGSQAPLEPDSLPRPSNPISSEVTKKRHTDVCLFFVGCGTRIRT